MYPDEADVSVVAIAVANKLASYNPTGIWAFLLVEFSKKGIL